MGDRSLGERLRQALSHGVAALGQLVAGQPAVQDAGGVVHLAVAQEVHGGTGRVGHGVSGARSESRSVA